MASELTLGCTSIVNLEPGSGEIILTLKNVNESDLNTLVVYNAIDVEKFCKHHGIVRAEE